MTELYRKLEAHLNLLYPEQDGAALAQRLVETMRIVPGGPEPVPYSNHWDQADAYVISYGDSLLSEDRLPLENLHHFLSHYLADSLSGVHILPFFPYSSDDGFSVIDYYQVNQSLGDWPQIREIAAQFDLMADVVINHCSARSGWFDNYRQRKDPGQGFFFEGDPGDDLSQVVRPRTSVLLQPVQTLDGERHVWCTFSPDQVDLDFTNPEVLVEFVSIIRYYLSQGIRVFRFDAVAFVWKIPGTPCINLPQTHCLVQLLRLLVEHQRSDAIIITETNIPNRENLAYFGNGNEAHAIYNFSLPPLLLNTLVTGDCSHLRTWLMTLPPARNGTAYFNFIASHDGIGLRPAEGILSEAEIDRLITTMEGFGGRISWRDRPNGQRSAYEINISLYDALAGTLAGPDSHQQARFLCAHAIMLGMEGIPAIYIHSLLATQNDQERVANTNHNRAINRHKWDYPRLQALLADGSSHHAQVFQAMKQLLAIRRCQPAFHPNATQFTLQLGDALLAFWRQSPDRSQSIFAIHNVTDKPQSLSLTSLNLIELDRWTDLLGGQCFLDLRQTLELAPYQSLWLSNAPVMVDDTATPTV
ncbi:sugar phosphorylase [Ferrimonas marina]|uniref:Sucrose phosphorylase n=1 Tax=Ferrimonas marina TaxID=299255 RepID=A0A1M5YI49_9GAMM|nr:sugar phosphorylase [Ferrimonas marina]SHI11193.1 sucrose phosphorylase [Ferrimonas marina]